MTCQEFLASVEDLAAAEAPADLAPELRAHADACPACAGRLDEAEALNRRLRGLRDAYKPPAQLAERVRAALRVEMSGAESVFAVQKGRALGGAAGTGISRPEGRSYPWVRLWRWAPAAVAALFLAAVVALVFGSGPGVPPLIADTVSAYEDISSGARRLDLSTGDPRAVQDYFQQRLHFWLPAPASVAAGSFALKGGCACKEAATGSQIPCVVYDRGGTLLTLLVVDRSRLDAAVWDRAERSQCRGRTTYHFTHRGICVMACPSTQAVHLWVSRLPAQDLCEAIQATPEGELALGGVRIAIEDLTCEMCCAGVREALAKVPGVKRVSVDVVRGEAQIVPEASGLPVQALIDALRRAGYRAKAVE